MTTLFRTNLRSAPLVASVGAVIILASALSSPNVKITDPTLLVIALVFFLIIIDAALGNYILITDDKVYVVDLFFYKRHMEISDISDIFYQPQFIGGVGAKMLTIYSKKNNRLRALSLGSNHFFSQQTLATIVHKVIKKNPKVELDETVRILINKYPNESVPSKEY